MADIKLKQHGMGCFLNIEPKFSLSEDSIFIVKKQVVLQYCTKTGQLLTEYGLKNPIVGIGSVVIEDFENILAFTECGDFCAWKTSTRFKTISKKLELKGKATNFYNVPNLNSNELEGIVTYQHSEKTSLCIVNIEKENFKNLNVILKGGINFLSVSEKRFFAVADSKSVQFIRMDNNDAQRQFFIADKKFIDVHITCLECHKHEEIVLTGDSEGKVIMWQNIFGNNPTRSIYHWHTLPVNCLAFSLSGSYFYSGGNEYVLVRWDWKNTNNKKFLPRLPGHLKKISISAKSQLIGIYMSNNQIKIVDSNMNNVSSIQHFLVGDNFTSGIAVDSRTKSLVMNGNIGQLQFHNPRMDSLLYSIDIVSDNKRSQERSLQIPNTIVTKFTFSINSLWLATIEECEIGYHTLTLKFWTLNMSSQMFELNTCISSPHKSSVSAILFQTCNEDEGLKCVTLCKNEFKIWHQITVKKSNVENIIWIMMKEFHFDMPCAGLSFSEEGSLMAIGSGPLLTIWTPDPCQMKEYLVCAEDNEAYIEKIEFGAKSCSHLIVAATKDRILVWDLLSLCLIRTVTLEFDFLLADKSSIFMAVISKDKELFIFSPNSGEPVFMSKDILSSKNIMAAAFLPKESCLDYQTEWYHQVELFFIDSNKEIFSVGEYSMEDYSVNQYADEDEEITLLLKKMMPFKKTNNVVESRELNVLQNSKNIIKELLDTPTRLIAPPRHNCMSYLRCLELKKI